MQIFKQLSDWAAARNTCPEEQIYLTDAKHAAKVGLPTLAALCEVLDQVSQARGRIEPQEMESTLRPVLSCQFHLKRRLHI